MDLQSGLADAGFGEAPMPMSDILSLAWDTITTAGLLAAIILVLSACEAMSRSR